MRKCFIYFLCVTSFIVCSSIAVAQSDDQKKSDIQNKIQEYENKLLQVRSQKKSLSSEIVYMDTQINLTSYRILDTEKRIVTTQNEVELLDNKINNLDSSLDYLSKLLLHRVVAGYKKRSYSFFDILFNSVNADEVVNDLKYAKSSQDNNQKLLLQVQTTKTNFEEQKKIRETKKVELDSLKVSLGQQKNDLIQQQAAKKRLLDVTNNDELTYQRLLDQAQKELSAFSSFVKNAGGGAVGANSFGRGKEGWYLSQRDERWASKLIGMSDMNLLQVGCLITDIAMVYNKYGESVTPADIASQSDRFFSNTAMMLIPWRGPGGKSYTGISTSQIDAELANNNLVIVGLYAGNYGTHFVTLVRKEGGDYIMYDPYYGPDLQFSSRYSFGSIFSAVTFK